MTASIVTERCDVVAEDFARQFAGHLPQSAIDSTVALLKRVSKGASATTAYPATGSIASAIIWMSCKCTITGGKSFDGDSWGIAIPGGGALFGDVYTDDINSLYANTKTFALVAAPGYTNFSFFDGNAQSLGVFHAGAVSTVSGTGGGKGSWS